MSAEKLQLEVKILSRCSANSKVDSREKGKFSCEGKSRAVFSAHHLFVHFKSFFCFPGQAHNFNKYSHGKLDYLGAMYDFQSLMHYGSRAFSKNGKRTIKALKQSGVEFGQRKGFSETDIQQLNALYDCKSK